MTNSIRKDVLGNQEERTERRADRLQGRITKAQEKSTYHYNMSNQHCARFANGQPILIGHHSEKSARSAQKKGWDSMGRSVEESKKAEYLEYKLAGVGTAGISSTDTNAIELLQEKLEKLEKNQELMKEVNKIIKSKKSDSEKIAFFVQKFDISEEKAQIFLKPNVYGLVGFESWKLSNNSATIRSTKKRIADLEKLHSSEVLADKGTVDGLEWEILEDDGRIHFIFNEKPDEKKRTWLKDNGFKWSRYSSAWVRKITSNAVHVSKNMIKQLKTLETV